MLTIPGAHAADSVIASVTGTRFPDDAGAYGGGLAIQHAGVFGGVLVGLNTMRFPIGTLTDFDADTYRTIGKWSFTAGASLGRANADDSVNTLLKGRFLVDFKAGENWTLHAGDTYVHLARVEGQLLSGAAEYRISPQWSLKAGGGYAVNGTLADRYGIVELNGYGPEHVFLGVIDGRTGYDPAALGQVSVVSKLFQIYSGAGVPVGKTTLLLGLDSLDLEGQHRQTLRIGFSRPIRP